MHYSQIITLFLKHLFSVVTIIVTWAIINVLLFQTYIWIDAIIIFSLVIVLLYRSKSISDALLKINKNYVTIISIAFFISIIIAFRQIYGVSSSTQLYALDPVFALINYIEFILIRPFAQFSYLYKTYSLLRIDLLFISFLISVGISEFILFLCLSINILLSLFFDIADTFLKKYQLYENISPQLWYSRLLIVFLCLIGASILFLAGTYSNLFIPKVNFNKLPNIPAYSYDPIEIYTLLVSREENNLYIGTEEGLFRKDLSTDNSELEWIEGFSGVKINRLVESHETGTIYAGTSQGVFEYSLQTGSWKQISTPDYVQSLVINNDATLFYGTLQGLYSLTNSDRERRISLVGLPDSNIVSLQNAENRLFVGTDSGLYQWIYQNNEWQYVDQIIKDERIQSISVISLNQLIIGTHRGIIEIQLDNNQKWQITNKSLMEDNITCLVADSDYLFVCAGDQIYTSPKYNINWENLVFERFPGSYDIKDLAIDRNNHDIFIPTNNIVKIFDLKAREIIQEHLVKKTTTIPYNGQVTDFSINPFDGTIYAVVESDTKYTATTKRYLFRLTKGGSFWEYDLADGFVGDDFQAYYLDIRTNTLYIWTEMGLFKLESSDHNWQQINRGVKGVIVNTMTAASNERGFYISTTNGVYKSLDAGQSWQPFAQKGYNIRGIKISNKTGRIYILLGDDILWSNTNGNQWFSLQKENAVPWQSLFAFMDGCGEIIVPENSKEKIWIGCPSDLFGWLFSESHFITQSLIQKHSEDFCYILYSPNPNEIYQGKANNKHCYESTPFYNMLSWVRFVLSLSLPLKIIQQSIPIVVLIILFIWVFQAYTKYMQDPYRLTPLWVFLLPIRPKTNVFPLDNQIEDIWPSWEDEIHRTLFSYGKVHFADLELIPNQFRNYALKTFYSKHKDHLKLMLKQNELVFSDINTMYELQKHYQIILDATKDFNQNQENTVFAQNVDVLINIFVDVLGFNLCGNRNKKNAYAFLVEAPTLRLRLPLRFPIIFVVENKPKDETLSSIIDLIELLGNQSYFALIIPVCSSEYNISLPEMLSAIIKNSPYAHDLIILNYDDLLNTFMASDVIQAFMNKVLHQRNITMVSPFVINGPVPETMFFGREHEIRKLSENIKTNDFAIIGNRKVGKTSLLKRFSKQVAINQQENVIWLDCQTVRKVPDLFSVFKRQTGLEIIEGKPSNFSDTIQEMYNKSQSAKIPVILLMDEIDGILSLPGDLELELFAHWRSLSQLGYARFVFCGSRTLVECLEDASSSFYNFPQSMQVGLLSEVESKSIITQPLDTMGVIIENSPVLLNKVYDVTSGHPNLVQYIGKELIEAANKRGERRILFEDLEDILHSSAFAEYYLRTIWGAVNSLEKIITLVSPIDGFDQYAIEIELEKLGLEVDIEDLDKSLKLLCVFSILENDGQNYRYKINSFPEILHQTQNIERLLALEKRRI